MVAHCLFEQSSEVWRDVKGFEGIYQVSSLGRVKSLSRNISFKGTTRELKEKILKNNFDKFGYVYYFLYKNGKYKRVKGHRLVAETFLPNPNKLPMVNHKDEVKHNNSIDNLEWCDATYNLNYGSRSSKYTKEIIKLDLQNKTILKEYESMKMAESDTGVSHSKISAVCYGKRKSAGGYGWRFKKDYE